MTGDINQIRETFIEGRVFLFDKPLKWTSFDVVNKIKSILRHRLEIKKIKIGHAGTLDPLASGLLIICTGKATRQIELYQDLPKTYTGTFVIGQITPSYDLETLPEGQYPTSHITAELINKTANSFIGKQLQLPPIYSAKKIEGKRAYTLARKGKHAELKPKEISISAFDITRIELPEVDFRVTCSKGTYIRGLARDFGEKMESGAYLGALRRTDIGQFSVSQAIQMHGFEELFSPNY